MDTKQEKLYARCKSSIEDYADQTRNRITKKLVRETVEELNFDKLTPKQLDEVRDTLVRVLVG